MSDGRLTERTVGPKCPRCTATMKDVVTIAPVGDDPGLIAYECPSCQHITSELIYSPRPNGHEVM